MKWIVNSEEMKACDSNTITHFGVPSLVLMERAALSVAEQVQKQVPAEGSILIVCGSGNNGADGLAAARLLHQQGYRVDAVQVPDCKKRSTENQLQRDILERYGIHITEHILADREYDCVIDALFGIGLSRAPGGVYAEWIRIMNRLGGFKIAVDMPSGVSSDDGRAYDPAFDADLTVTFAYQKAGQILYPGCEKCGEVITAKIGITDDSWLERKPACYTLETEDLKNIPPRPSRSNKGTFGRVLAVAGSKNMAGAALFCAQAAYRTGCGLVKIYTSETNRIILQSALPEAVLVTYDETEEVEPSVFPEAKPSGRSASLQEDQSELPGRTAFPEADLSGRPGLPEEEETILTAFEKKGKTQEPLADAVKWADVIILGPGIGQNKKARAAVAQVLRTADVPVIADADALNILAQQPDLLRSASARLILTPHLGEMARLCKKQIPDIQNTMRQTAEEFAAQYHLVCVLKDAVTVTASASGTCLNTSGCSAMAKGGSGDVLAGIIAALAAQGMEPEEAAQMGVYIHGLAGEAAARQKGSYSVLARDIIDGIGAVLGTNIL